MKFDNKKKSLLLIFCFLFLIAIFSGWSNFRNHNNILHPALGFSPSPEVVRPAVSPTQTITLNAKSPFPSSGPTKTIAASPAPLRFIAMADSRGSDNGINSEIIVKTFKSIKRVSPQPEFFVIPGDLVDGSRNKDTIRKQFTYFKNTASTFYDIKTIFPGFGNHEATAASDGEQAFNEVFSEFNANFLNGFNKTVYYFDRGPARFYMLNSNHPGESNTISDKQLEWLKQNLDNNKKFNIFFLHDPLYPTGAHIGSSLDQNKAQRAKLLNIINSANNPLIFCGHEHNYTRRHIDSSFNEKAGDVELKLTKTIYQVTVGTFGAPFYSTYKDTKGVDVPPITKYHYAVADISSTGINVTVYSIYGEVIDKFSQTAVK